MKKILYLLFVLFFATTSYAQQIYYFKFKLDNKKELRTITRLISIDNYRNDTIWAYANEDELAEFTKYKYKIQFMDKPSASAKNIVMATTLAQMSTWDKYPIYEVYQEMLQKMATDYPEICKLQSFGTTHDQRELYVLKISDNVKDKEAEPEFFYTSTMHGDEITGMILLLRLADHLLVNYNKPGYEDITALVNDVEIWINPNINPDGTYRTIPDSDNAIENQTVANAERYNENSKDINRNFPDPVGGQNPTGTWQAETIAMMNFASAHNFIMGGSFHGGAEVMNYPWDTWKTIENPHPDTQWLENVSATYVQLARQQYTGYMDDITESGVTQGGDWYEVEGGIQDYMNYWHHCRKITIECSLEKLIPSSELNAYWNYNKNSLIQFIKEATYGIHGTVKNSNNQPLNAQIFIKSHDKDGSEVYTDLTSGDYHRPIAAGTYEVIYSSEGYKSQTWTITVANNQTIIKDVILQDANIVDITGTVTETITKTPIQGATIEILDHDYAPVLTDENGHYTIYQVPENTYNIRASKTNYASLSQNVDITLTNNVVDFLLRKSIPVGFENNIPTDFNFPDGLWTRTNQTFYQGNWSIKSAEITNSEQTNMTITKNTHEGEITFFVKVSSEDGWDFLYFYIDNIEKAKWSGEKDWTSASFFVEEGTHTYKWSYQKDDNSSEGSDCAWVDEILFPAEKDILNYDITFSVTDETLPIATPIANAKIEIANYDAQYTDSNGKTTFINILPNDNIAYTVTAENYVIYNGNINLNADVNVDVKLQLIVNIKDTNELITLFPNPNKGIFNIVNNLDDKIEINIYNCSGTIVYHNFIDNNISQINLAGLPKGVYFLKTMVNQNYYFKKIIIL